ncbi:N-acetylmuramic acid 6-phosphate etherase [Telmatospirillum sp.]|uniref:N-acetylmuramic acid 6-phosphate etherase n=1 Tax=Telmatospirillum sp. TaxID=2079197 RepID=UPI00284B37BF|nr:N-acetylmuramic acid 6-phosphate etherase [Telmatospirillum sp.]MDR3438264.1 N-acetylmuramic acid 6-phosphate etherase [Telmatospirillum sp.]
MDPTEEAASRYRGMDVWPVQDVLHALWSGQMTAAAACLHTLPALTQVVEAAASRLGAGHGRLIYVGAGSAGMVAALDASDLGDTFDWPSDRLEILLAGGLDLSRGLAAEIEDDGAAGRDGLRALTAGPDDVVIGVSASGRSVFTIAAIEVARQAGALTVAVTSNTGTPLIDAAQYPLVVVTGPEVVVGSTRLGAGTAQKVILNLFSTAVMVRLGRVHDNLMVDVRPRNAKLRRRCTTMVARISGVEEAVADEALARYGDVKSAVLGLAGASADDIPDLLAAVGGNLRRALANVRPDVRPTVEAPSSQQK